VAESTRVSRIKYRNPPVIERALVVHLPHPVPEEQFQVKADEWRAALIEDFPHLETMTEWTLRVIEKQGIPVLDTANQTMTLRQTFWQVGPAQKKKQGMQLWQDKISFNVLGEIGDPREFEELRSLVKQWLSKWVQDFDIKSMSGVTLQYVNLLSKRTLPTFMEGNKLKIGEAIRLFGGIPVQRELLLPPFDFQVNLRVDDVQPPAQLSAHCISVEAPKEDGPTMHLRFTATTNLGPPARVVPLDNLDAEAEVVHNLIIQSFQAYFTDAAKNSFQPCP
jgi:hypothetical protein